jgi:hypothetical protein
MDEDGQLLAPMNDIPLIREVLKGRGVPERNISVLADGVPGAGLPTRKAILDALNALPRKIRRGDFVYLHFSGHGARQPEPKSRKLSNEPDGLDEIFLPRDVGEWDDVKEMVPNAIIDDELNAAISAIRNKGAFVWAVFDACHSATATRGEKLADVRVRELSAQKLRIPDERMRAARARAVGNVPKDGALEGATALQPDAGGAVFFYAAQTNEETLEFRQPDRSKGSKSYGLFSWTLAQVLTLTPQITYRQAAERILQLYSTRKRPVTPVFEGELDAPVFGSKAGEVVRQWQVSGLPRSPSIAAGALHEIGEGAIFGLLPHPAALDSQGMAYAQASVVDSLRSALVPVAYAGQALRTLPTSAAWARLVDPKQRFGLRLLRPRAEARGEAVRLAGWIEQAVKASPRIRLSWVEEGGAVDASLRVAEGRVWLLPPTGEMEVTGARRSPSIDIRRPDAAVVEDMRLMLERIARVNNLMRLARQTLTSPAAQNLDVVVSLARGGQPAVALDPSKMPSLVDRDVLRFAIRNQAKNEGCVLRKEEKIDDDEKPKKGCPIDVTLLYVESDYGIVGVYPVRGETNRVDAGAALTIELPPINATTIGVEGVILIATEAEPYQAPANFTFLEQQGLTRLRGEGPESAAADVTSTTLTALFEDAGFGETTRRGTPQTTARALSRTAMRLFSWKVERAKP